MSGFENREGTQLAFDTTYEIDYYAEDIWERGAQYLETLAACNFFLEAMQNYLAKGTSAFAGDVTNVEDILAFIKHTFTECGVKGDKGAGEFSYNPSLLKRWAEGRGLPSQKEALRLALCLGMTVEDAAEFIFKSALTRPFNFKNLYDAVGYFCLANGKTFRDAQRILERVEHDDGVPEVSPENDTVVIGERVSRCRTEEELVRYLTANKAGFADQSRAALQVLDKLVEQAADLAEWERKTFFEDADIPEIKGKENVPAILNVVLGYEARANIGGVDVYKNKIDKSNFPYLIRNNFPQPQSLQSFLQRKTVSVEGIRKAIILFTFYNLFATMKQNKVEANGFDDYADAVDEALAKCGYVQMYWKHPYDWMFGYCAAAIDPLDELREMIAAFYQDLDENYSLENQYDKGDPTL